MDPKIGPKSVQKSVPNGRVIKYPQKCALFCAPGDFWVFLGPKIPQNRRTISYGKSRFLPISRICTFCARGEFRADFRDFPGGEISGIFRDPENGPQKRALFGPLFGPLKMTPFLPPFLTPFMGSFHSMNGLAFRHEHAMRMKID